MNLLNIAPSSDEPNVFDTGLDNFSSTVIERSKSVPVLVDFWAPWCEPCRTLTPILETLIQQFAGAVALAKVNLDDEQHLAAQFQVRSVPTVFLIKDGNVVDGFMGVQPEQAIRAMLSKHIDSPDMPKTDEIDDLIAFGRIDEAVAALKNDGSEQAKIRLADLHLRTGSIDEARAVLDSVDDSEHSGAMYKAAAARLHFAAIAESAPDEMQLESAIQQDPQDWNACYQLAAVLATRGMPEPAMARLLDIVVNDRSFNDDAGRKGLIMAFDMYESNQQLVAKYRRKLAVMLN